MNTKGKKKKTMKSKEESLFKNMTGLVKERIKKVN